MAASLKTHKNLLEEKVGEKSAPYTWGIDLKKESKDIDEIQNSFRPIPSICL